MWIMLFYGVTNKMLMLWHLVTYTTNNYGHRNVLSSTNYRPYFLCYFGESRKFHGSFWNLYLNFWQLMTNVLSLYKGPDQYILTICQDKKIFSSFSLHTMTAKLDVEVYTTCDVIWEKFVVWRCLFLNTTNTTDYSQATS